MDDLIESLMIFRSYMSNDVYAPTNCSHDELGLFVGVDVEAVSKAHVKRLDELGWFWEEDNEGWKSFRFGSC